MIWTKVFNSIFNTVQYVSVNQCLPGHGGGFFPWSPKVCQWKITDEKRVSKRHKYQSQMHFILTAWAL